jgi:hypothetical protein
MPILGTQGILSLKREAPPSVFLPASALNVDLSSFQMVNQDYWTGDEVYFSSPNGIPVDPAAIPDGAAMYFGGIWPTGSNRQHITADTDNFYTPDDNVDFYLSSPAITGRHYFIHRDQFDRISFYESYADALNGEKAKRVQLFQLPFQPVLLSPRGTADYDNALVDCVSKIVSYRQGDIRDETTLESICDFAPEYQSPVAGVADYDNADVTPRRLVGGFPWKNICLLREWSLNLDGPSVDTSCIAQKFGEAVKSMVSGGGTIDFMVDRVTHGQGTSDPTDLLQLLFMTEKGAKAEAEFWMIEGREQKRCTGLLSGDLYYAAEILITNTALNVRPDELVAGSATFVTTGPIRVRMGQAS